MGNKLKFSWLRPQSSADPAEAERKKQNRRSFSAFSALSSPKSKETISNGADAKPAPVPEEPAPAAFDVKTDDMVALAKKIAAETEKIEAYLKKEGLPSPGFGVDSPPDFPKLPAELQKSRQEVVYATMRLGQLVRGPREGLRWGIWGVSLELWCSWAMVADGI